MSYSSLDILPNDILYEIFGYLSPIDVIESFFSLSKRLSRIIVNEYVWHIRIGDSTMSLSMFNDHCQNVLQLIGGRVVSLRLILINVINGWPLISSSLRSHSTTFLQRLHLIDIEPHEFDKLLRSQLIKQIHTLLVDITSSNRFNCLQVEGVYLVQVCSRMPLVKICRLPFNHDVSIMNQIKTFSLGYQMTLPNLLNANHLRTLTVGIHSSYFLGRLLLCIPFVENLSFGIDDRDINESDFHEKISMPATIGVHLLRHLSRLRIYCLNSISFHRTIALLSSVFGQLHHLSLKLLACTFISGPLIISGDIIQQLCIDRFQPTATYSLDLVLHAKNDLEEKIIFNSFFKVPFTHRQRPRVFIQECSNMGIGYMYHCFMVYTLPYKDEILPSNMLTKDLEESLQMSTSAIDLFPRANQLMLHGYKFKKYRRDPGNCISSMSSLVPWSLITNISINHSDAISVVALQSILRMAYNVHKLRIFDDTGVLLRALLYSNDNLELRVNQQVKSLDIYDVTWTLQNVERFCILLSNRFPNLKTLSMHILDSYDQWKWRPSRIIDGKNKSTKRIVNLVYLLVDNFKQLVSLDIYFSNENFSDTPCFPHLIRRQLYQYPPSRPHRLQCSSNRIQLWL
ncbi:unnamed protein product [Rotaria socialis]|uniref:F-box domain-containing protein n=1 Tax=Rotaria socialis TaxID=392032 RepID=A0A821APP3_9BILA|nr:unnamed protein product [Rotaria socialis]CAF3341180.1 unnamed protein product [Rotaria socialis]CAF3393037.1 unnamed protein product [Rotaria socialis]CAF4475857.1 unnamed protein product [Rotaria socialis]CAF4579941.1 unnamed protein product [Rotaria socialis]